MSAGYRCVNFNDLCRLCSSAGSNNVQIFSDDGLQKKIVECLPITLYEKDKLPKVICAQCLEYVEVFSDFREACLKAQRMLESCLNTSKLRNGGQVYIKDEVPVKKVLKPIQSPSTKIMPNLCNIITSTPPKQVKKNIITSQNQPDFLSSIMQAVGIQTNEEAQDNKISFSQNIQPQQTMQSVPQYTLTLDGGTLKSGQIQYKIENAANLNIPNQAQLVATKSVQDQNQGHQANTISMEEFLKMKKSSVVVKKSPVATSQVEEPKNKKPKFNLILQTSPQKPKIGSQVTVSPVNNSFASPPSLSTPSKSQIKIHNIEKILPVSNQSSVSKQLVLPIMVRNDGTRNAEAAQLISQALTMSNNQTNIESKQQGNPPFAYVQMKIQPNADGQLTLTQASPLPTQQHLQLSLSPQQLQQLSFQAPAQQQLQQQITVAQVASQEQTDSQTQTPTQETQKDDPIEDDETFDDQDDFFFMKGDETEDEGQSQDKIEVKPEPEKKISNQFTITVRKKAIKPAKKVKHEDLTDLQSVQQEHSDIANKQLSQLTSLHSKRVDAEAAEKPMEMNLTVCDVCKKVFKRKEFLMQHLKSHIGLRPFKCDEPTCNKSFSRKEHLLRHVVSHTGKKMFSCDVCKKLFSRKDNLNKHRRIHPDSAQSNVRHSCQTCSKAFSHRAQLQKHMLICDGKSDGAGSSEETLMKPDKPAGKTVQLIKKKFKADKKDPETTSKTQTPAQAPVVQQQQQQFAIVQQQQPQSIKLKSDPQQQQQQIILSMSQAQAMLQQPKGAVYTFPTNLILNTNGTFMTSGDVVNNFKFENQ